MNQDSPPLSGSQTQPLSARDLADWPYLQAAEAAPPELAALDRWNPWTFYAVNGEKPKKLPTTAELFCQWPRKGLKQWNDPAKWQSLQGAAADALTIDGRFPGSEPRLGFMLFREDEIVGIDLDDVREPRSGRLEGWAADIVEELRTYTEVSPSGRGLRIFVKGRKPGAACKRGRVEMYDQSRFVSFTGQRLPGCPWGVEARQEELDALYLRTFGPPRQATTGGAPASTGAPRPPCTCPPLPDDEILRRLQADPRGAALWEGRWEDAGYGSHSEADLALAGRLVRLAGGDLARADALFRQGGLFRPKWDQSRGGETYGERTLRKAAETRGGGDGCPGCSIPSEGGTPPDDDILHRTSGTFEADRVARGGAPHPRMCGTTVLTRKKDGPIHGRRATCHGLHCPYCGSRTRAQYEVHLAPLLEAEGELYHATIPLGVWERERETIKKRLTRAKARYRWFATDRVGHVEVLSTMDLSDFTHHGGVPLAVEDRRGALHEVLLHLRPPVRKGERLHGGSRAWQPLRARERAVEEVFLGVSASTPTEIQKKLETVPWCEAFVDSADEQGEATACTILMFPTASMAALRCLIGIHDPAPARRSGAASWVGSRQDASWEAVA